MSRPIPGRAYFWRNNRLEILDRFVITGDFNQSVMLKYLYCPCVMINEHGRTYVGWFDQSENYHVGWMPYDINKFEPEFRAHLLLLGVS